MYPLCIVVSKLSLYSFGTPLRPIPILEVSMQDNSKTKEALQSHISTSMFTVFKSATIRLYQG